MTPNTNDPLRLKWTDAEELPDFIESDGIVQNVTTKDVTHSDGSSLYVVFHVKPAHDTLNRVLKDAALEVSFPASVNDESLLGKALKRSGMKSDEVDLSGLFGATVRFSVFRVEKKTAEGTRKFYQVERESFRFLSTPQAD